MNLKSLVWQDKETGAVYAWFNLKYLRLYVKRGYIHKIDEIKKELADDGWTMLDWEVVD